MSTFVQAEMRAVRKATETHRLEYVTVDARGSFHALCALRCRLQKLVEILAIDEYGQVLRWKPNEQEGPCPACEQGGQPQAAGDCSGESGEPKG